VNLLVDQSYSNYFQSCKCSGSITENRRWKKQVKKAVSNAKGRSFRRAFLGIAAETKFSLKVSGHQVVQ